MRRRALVVLCVAGFGLFLFSLWGPSEDSVCSHALSLVPSDWPVQPTASDCHMTLNQQSGREWPFTYAAQRRCYRWAGDLGDFHDCGGELAHFVE
jgi:hypothetical protein